MKKAKLLDTFLLCLKILLPFLIVIPLIFFSYRLAQGRISDLRYGGTAGYHSGLGLYIFASHTVLLLWNAMLTVIGLIGLFLAKKCRTCLSQPNHIATFRRLSYLPLCNQALYALITVIIVNLR